MHPAAQRFPQAQIDPSAHVAESAILVGPVTIAAQAVIAHGAVLSAEGGRISVGRNSIVMENSVLRSTRFDDCLLGEHVLVGPHCHLSGCVIGDEVFVATGVSVFNGAHVGQGAELRINAVVHISTRIACGATVPIGWVAVGDPAQLFAPDQHEARLARAANAGLPAQGALVSIATPARAPMAAWSGASPSATRAFCCAAAAAPPEAPAQYQ